MVGHFVAETRPDVVGDVGDVDLFGQLYNHRQHFFVHFCLEDLVAVHQLFYL
jgi:hypothetical protein